MLNSILEHLEHLNRRTGMYVQPLDIASILNYLHGLQNGCRFGGLDVSREVYETAAAARGWKLRATGIVWHMKAKKLSDEAIIQELIAVAAEAFRRAASAPQGEEKRDQLQ